MSAATLPAAETDRRLKILEACEGNVSKAAIELGISRGAMQNTVRMLLAQRREIPRREMLPKAGTKGLLDYEIQDGVAVFGADAHVWPDIETPGYRAFLWALNKFRKDGDLAMAGLLGDWIDGAKLSRHPPMGWEKLPAPVEEIGAVQLRCRDVRKAAGPKAKFPWCLGNHDARYEMKTAHLIPELAGVHGVHLKDHFPEHEPCWMFRINGHVYCKHRYKNGIHAAHNNTVNAGVTIVTGHLHSGKIAPFSDYHGTRWGVDGGTLAAPYGPQFEYTELNPVNWVSVVPVLSFYGGRLLWPELVHVIDDHHWSFRGKIYEG